MSTLASLWADIKTALSDIKDAIIARGVDVPTGTPITDYDDLIMQIIGSGGSTALPKLNAVSISRNGDTITISNPSTNGGFVVDFAIYDGDDIVTTQAATSNTFSLAALGVGSYHLAVKAISQYFRDSDASNVINASVYSITRTFTNLSITNPANVIANGLPYEGRITPAANKFLPEDITVTMGGRAYNNFEYDSYTGDFRIASVTGNVVITAVADDARKLRRPALELDGSILTVTPPRYAKRTTVSLDGTVESDYTIVDNSTYAVEDISGVTYGFTQNANGYYESQCNGVSSGFALCKITFDLDYEKEITLKCINYGENYRDYGIISKPDCALAQNNNDDGSTGSGNVLHNFYSESSPNVVDIPVTMSAGQHYIIMKYRKDGSGNTGNDSFQFKVDM